MKILNTRGFWAGFIIGLFYFSYIFWWFWSLYPLDSLGLQNRPAAATLIFLVFSACVAITAVFWGLFGFFTEKLYRNSGDYLFPPVLAGIFTLLEYARSIFFSIFWYGSGGTIGPYWSQGNLAYLLVDIDWATTTASFWGIYGIGFCIVWFLSALIPCFLQKRFLKIYILQIVFIVLVFLGLNIAEIEPQLLSRPNLDNNPRDVKPISVAVIQTNVPSAGFSTSEEILEDFRIKLQLLEKAVKEIEKGVIIFPEGTNLSKMLANFLGAEDIQKFFENLSLNEILIVDSLRTLIKSDDLTSNTVFISSKKGIIDLYGKQVLVPIGEFLPYIIELPLKIANSDYPKKYAVLRKSNKGSGDNIINYGDYNIKILICSELISPTKTNHSNFDFIILTGGYAIWNQNKFAARQILSAARFRAIENGKYLVLAANSDSSYIIGPQGKIEKSASPYTYELLTGEIVPNKRRTWYNYLGDWPILLLSAALFGLGIKKNKFM